MRCPPGVQPLRQEAVELKLWLGLGITVFLAGSVMFWVVGANPLEAWGVLLHTSLGNAFGLSQVLEKTSVFTLTGLAFLFAFRAGFWNIGAEGQLMMGALMSYSVAQLVADTTQGATLPLMIGVAAGAGALWALIPALLRLRFRVNEILSTLMLNYVAVHWVRIFVNLVWKDERSAYPVAARLPKVAQFPGWRHSELHLGMVLSVVALVVVYFIFAHSPLGHALRAQGQSPKAARYAGISLSTMILVSFLFSGALAGLAGVHELAGSGSSRLRDSIGLGLGFAGIPVALLADGDPKKVPLAALFFSVLFVGSQGLKTAFGIPFGLHEVFLGVIVLVKLIYLKL